MSRETGPGPGPEGGRGIPEEPQGDSEIGKLRKKYRLLPSTPGAGPRNPFDDGEREPTGLPEGADVPGETPESEPLAGKERAADEAAAEHPLSEPKKRRSLFGRRKKEKNPSAPEGVPSALKELERLGQEDQEKRPLVPPEVEEQELKDPKLLRARELLRGVLQGHSKEHIQAHEGSAKLQEVFDRLRAGEELPEATFDAAFWARLADAYAREADMTLALDDARKLGPGIAESFHALMEKGVITSAMGNADILRSYSRAAGPEAAYALYEELKDVLDRGGWGVGEGGQRRPYSDTIAEQWLQDARGEIVRREADIAEFWESSVPGELQAQRPDLDEPLVPERRKEQLTAVLAYLHRVEQHIDSLRRQERESRWAEFGPKKKGRKPSEEEQDADAGETPPQTLEDHRTAYARALKNRSRLLFGRTSEEEVVQLRENYHGAIRAESAQQIEAIKAEFSGKDMADSAMQAELQAKLVEMVLGGRQEEESAFREALRTSAEKTASEKFKRFWRKHPYMRLAISGVLWGGVKLSMSQGNVVAAGVMQGIRGAMSGTGTTMATEATWELARGKFGATKELSDEEITTMTQGDLERRLAAHTTSYADTGRVEFGKQQRGVLAWKHEDTTGQRLLAEYNRRQQEVLKANIQRDVQGGKSVDEVITKRIEEAQWQSRYLHARYESQRGRDRRNAIAKWTVALGAGAVTGALVGIPGASKVFKVFGAKDAAEPQPGVPGGADSAHAHEHASHEHAPHIAAEAPSTPDVGAGGQMAEQADGAAVVEQPPADAAKSWIGERMAEYNTEHTSAAADATAQAEHLAHPSDVDHATSVADSAHAASEQLVQDVAQGVDAGHQFPSAVEKFPGIVDPDKVPETENPAAHWFAQDHARPPSTFEEFTSEHPPVAGQSAEAAAQVAASSPEALKVDPVEVVKKGDSVWKLARHQLEARFGGEFTGLDEARQTYVIDSIKDRIAEHPGDFGLHDADTIAAGEKIDFSPIFGDQHLDTVKSAFTEAQNLNESAVQNILENNRALEHWVASHPAEHLTSAKVEEILHPVATAASDLGIHRDSLGIAQGVSSGATEVMASHDASWAADVQCRLAEQVVAQHHPDWSQAEISSAADMVRDAVSGGAEAGHGTPIELTPKGAKAVHALRKATDALFASVPRESADKMLHAVTQLDAETASQKGAIERTIDHLQDGTSEMGKNIGKNVRKVLGVLPKDSIRPNDTVGTVFARVREVK